MKKHIFLLLCICLICFGCSAETEWQKLQVTEPVKANPVIDWAATADSCTFVLIEQFMNKEKGTFWKSPKDVSGGSYNIYWQQAHAIDVVLYSYERIKDSNPTLAATYENYFESWYLNHGNNYHHDKDDPTGFSNPFTDDMCWISLTLLRMTEVLNDDKFALTAKDLYDKYIITRAWKDSKGTGLPWKSNDKSRNACTNSPGCLVAAKLYKKFGGDKYLEEAKTLYNYVATNLLKSDGSVENPPLTYTQGTFGEACRTLYHITGERKYMRNAELSINYTMTSERCLSNWILRDEGANMDQSIFKAVFVPYAVNLALDADASSSTRQRIKLFLEDNAKALWKNMDRKEWPAMFCNYYWGSIFPSGDIASMGAQASGASLMEGITRMMAALEK